ncbi:MAG: site-specific DNA-methyltransferase [Candidatus Heimdallarchaeota archaeon]
MVNLEWNGKKSIRFDSKLSIGTNLSLKLVEYINSPLNDKIIRKNAIENKKEWDNILILGENKLAIELLLKRFENKINLIYFDPPFATGGEFNLKILIGQKEQPNSSQRWINKIAYNDSWKGGIDDYLNFMYERLLLMRKLLSDSGSIYVHLDWHMVHYLKIVMDEIFGPENFRNEIIWAYPSASVQTRNFFVRSFDAILFYTKSDDYVFNDDPNIYMEYSDRVKRALKKDEKGIYYHRGGSHNGKKLSQKVYIEKNGVFPRDVWNDIPYVRANTIEYQGFSTQKPERLLKRIILASTRKDDIVADFFCGSGTTLVTAEKLGRRWIGCDVSKFAINMTYKRIIDLGNGNDIFHWKKLYNKRTKPFKLYRINEKRDEYSIPIEFTSEKSIEHLNFSNRPFYRVEMKKHQNFFFIELIDYKVPYKYLISEEIKRKIVKWSDWIDYWAIDINYQGKEFINKWISYRTPKNRKLILKAGPFELKDSSSKHIMIKTYDIIGIETYQKLKISS